MNATRKATTKAARKAASKAASKAPRKGVIKAARKLARVAARKASKITAGKISNKKGNPKCNQKGNQKNPKRAYKQHGLERDVKHHGSEIRKSDLLASQLVEIHNESIRHEVPAKNNYAHRTHEQNKFKLAFV